MAKRFIDTDIFKKRNVKDLEAPYKLLFIYLFTDCNHAGIWEVDLDVAEIRLGFSYPEIETIEKMGECIQVLDGGSKWYINGFVEFQYGTLNETNRAHKSVIDILKKYKIKEGAYKTLTRPLQGCKDKDKDIILSVKDYYTKEMEVSKDKEKYELYVKFITYLFKTNPTGQPSVWLNLPYQVSYENFEKLHKLAGSLEGVYEKVDIAINKPAYLKDKKNVYLTLKNWIK